MTDGTQTADPDTTAGVRVTIQDARELGFCVAGTRTFLERNGLDFKSFLKGGLDASELLATGDAMATRVVAHASSKER